MMTGFFSKPRLRGALLAAMVAASAAAATETAMFGFTPERNMTVEAGSPAGRLERGDRGGDPVVGAARLPDLRRPPGPRGQDLRRHQQPGALQREAHRRPRRRRRLRARRRQLPVAVDAHQAPFRAGQRLAAAGGLLDAVRRGRAPVLRLQPLRGRCRGHRGVPRRRERRALPGRGRFQRHRRGRHLEARHDGGAQRLPAQPRGLLSPWPLATCCS